MNIVLNTTGIGGYNTGTVATHGTYTVTVTGKTFDGDAYSVALAPPGVIGDLTAVYALADTDACSVDTGETTVTATISTATDIIDRAKADCENSIAAWAIVREKRSSVTTPIGVVEIDGGIVIAQDLDNISVTAL